MRIAPESPYQLVQVRAEGISQGSFPYFFYYPPPTYPKCFPKIQISPIFFSRKGCNTKTKNKNKSTRGLATHLCIAINTFDANSP